MLTAISRKLGPVSMDVVVRETHESALRITRNPVEMGADISDHAFIEPKRLILEAVAAGGSISPAQIAAAYQSIVALQESREPFEIVTGLNLYRNMLIESVAVDRDKDTARVLYFTADCIEVIIVDTESNEDAAGSENKGKGGKQSNTSKGKLQKGDTQDRGSPKVDRGNVSAKEAPTTGNSADAVKNRSMLGSITGFSK